MKVYRIKDQNISYKREQNLFFMKEGLCPLEMFAARSRRDLRKPCFAALTLTHTYFILHPTIILFDYYTDGPRTEIN